MTGFGSLYYTDCRPGQGLQGGAGFQFQAATPGLALQVMPMVQRSGLYEPPSDWIRDGRPVERFPRSLAHTCQDGVYTTSAGRYLGQEANGMRQGNQFTHAVVTRDATAYGLTRPAQLWGARWWAAGPADDTELPGLPAQPATGPLDHETVRDRVRDSPGGQALLVALLSATQQLAEPARRRPIVLVSEDPELAACWVAAATLLLAQPAALRVSFKIFVADPQYGQHDIIAVHPDWAGQWADTRGNSGLAAFDLDLGRHSSVEPTESAVFWVPRFLAGEAYDVVDAVELAGQLAGERADDPADRLVAMVIAAGEPLAEPGALDTVATWLASASEQAVRIAHDHNVLGMVLGAAPPAGVLHTLTTVADRRGWPADAARLRSELFAAELAQVRQAPAGLAAFRLVKDLPELERPRAGEPEQRRLQAALRDADVARVPALLWLADRHGLTSRPADFPPDFVPWWLEQPDRELSPALWNAPEYALDAAQDVLEHWLASDPGRAEKVVRSGWWSGLLDSATDPSRPLHRLVVRTAYPEHEPAARARLIATVLDRSLARQPDGFEPCTLAWETVFGPTPPAPEDAFRFAEQARARKVAISGPVAEQLCAAIERDNGSARGLGIALALQRDGVALSGRVAELVGQDEEVRELARQLCAKPDHRTVAGFAEALDALSTAQLERHLPELVNALAGAPKARSLGILRQCGPRTARAIHRELRRQWPTESSQPNAGQCRAAAFTYLLVTDETRDDQLASDLDNLRRGLAARVGPMPKEDLEAIEGGHPDGHLGKPWRDWVKQQRRGVMSRLLRLPGRLGPRHGGGGI
jgi:hypothetical protein